jgi:guanylate kinase
VRAVQVVKKMCVIDADVESVQVIRSYGLDALYVFCATCPPALLKERIKQRDPAQPASHIAKRLGWVEYPKTLKP